MNTQPTLTDAATLQAWGASAANLRGFMDAVNGAFPERRNEVKALMLGLITRQHVLLLGPPGTAKSALTRTFCTALGGRYFEYLMGKFTQPEAVLGPYSISGLKADTFERKLDGYLATAEIAFLDEIFKSNNAMLNTLLSVLNERIIVNGAGKVHACPLESLVGASNELPDEDAGMEALYDRFLFRCDVADLRNRDTFLDVVTGPAPAVGVKINRADLDAVRKLAATVDVTPVRDLIGDLRDALARNHGVMISTRRWRWLVDAIRANAALAGRNAAQGTDLMALLDALWSKPTDRAAIASTLANMVSPDLAAGQKLYDAAVEQFGKVDSSFASAEAITQGGMANRELKKIVQEMQRLDQSAVGELTEKVQAMQEALRRSLLAAQGLGD